MWTELNPEGALQAARTLAREAGRAILERLAIERVDAVCVMGSGWKEAADGLGRTISEIPMEDIPGFIRPSAAGHAGTIRLTAFGDRRFLVFFGRTHLYEGYGPMAVAHGVRSAVAAGARVVLLTNACGSMNPNLPVGRPALIRDHINFTGRMPMVGANFVDLTDTYSPRLREMLHAKDPSLGEGVYAGWHGPAFETPAEIQMMHRLGADLVGMSTVLEAIAAREAGAEVVGLSLVTNQAAGLGGTKLSGREVLDTAQAAVPALRSVLERVAEVLTEA